MEKVFLLLGICSIYVAAEVNLHDDNSPIYSIQTILKPSESGQYCYCSSRDGRPTVSQTINTYSQDLERLVVYIYKRPGLGFEEEKVFLYIPDKAKQLDIPDLPFNSNSDLLEEVEANDIRFLINDSPFAVRKKRFPTAPNGETDLSFRSNPKQVKVIEEYKTLVSEQLTKRTVCYPLEDTPGKVTTPFRPEKEVTLPLDVPDLHVKTTESKPFDLTSETSLFNKDKLHPVEPQDGRKSYLPGVKELETKQPLWTQTTTLKYENPYQDWTVATELERSPSSVPDFYGTDSRPHQSWPYNLNLTPSTYTNTPLEWLSPPDLTQAVNQPESLTESVTLHPAENPNTNLHSEDLELKPSDVTNDRFSELDKDSPPSTITDFDVYKTTLALQGQDLTPTEHSLLLNDPDKSIPLLKAPISTQGNLLLPFESQKPKHLLELPEPTQKDFPTETLTQAPLEVPATINEELDPFTHKVLLEKQPLYGDGENDLEKFPSTPNIQSQEQFHLLGPQSHMDPSILKPLDEHENRSPEEPTKKEHLAFPDNEPLHPLPQFKETEPLNEDTFRRKYLPLLGGPLDGTKDSQLLLPLRSEHPLAHELTPLPAEINPRKEYTLSPEYFDKLNDSVLLIPTPSEQTPPENLVPMDDNKNPFLRPIPHFPKEQFLTPIPELRLPGGPTRKFPFLPKEALKDSKLLQPLQVEHKLPEELLSLEGKTKLDNHPVLPLLAPLPGALKGGELLHPTRTEYRIPDELVPIPGINVVPNPFLPLVAPLPANNLWTHPLYHNHVPVNPLHFPATFLQNEHFNRRHDNPFLHPKYPVTVLPNTYPFVLPRWTPIGHYPGLPEDLTVPAPFGPFRKVLQPTIFGPGGITPLVGDILNKNPTIIRTPYDNTWLHHKNPYLDFPNSHLPSHILPSPYPFLQHPLIGAPDNYFEHNPFNKIHVEKHPLRSEDEYYSKEKPYLQHFYPGQIKINPLSPQSPHVNLLQPSEGNLEKYPFNPKDTFDPKIRRVLKPTHFDGVLEGVPQLEPNYFEKHPNSLLQTGEVPFNNYDSYFPDNQGLLNRLPDLESLLRPINPDQGIFDKLSQENQTPSGKYQIFPNAHYEVKNRPDLRPTYPENGDETPEQLQFLHKDPSKYPLYPQTSYDLNGRPVLQPDSVDKLDFHVPNRPDSFSPLPHGEPFIKVPLDRETLIGRYPLFPDAEYEIRDRPGRLYDIALQQPEVLQGNLQIDPFYPEDTFELKLKPEVEQPNELLDSDFPQETLDFNKTPPKDGVWFHPINNLIGREPHDTEVDFGTNVVPDNVDSLKPELERQPSKLNYYPTDPFEVKDNSYLEADYPNVGHRLPNEELSLQPITFDEPQYSKIEGSVFPDLIQEQENSQPYHPTQSRDDLEVAAPLDLSLLQENQKYPFFPESSYELNNRPFPRREPDELESKLDLEFPTGYPGIHSQSQEDTWLNPSHPEQGFLGQHPQEISKYPEITQFPNEELWSFYKPDDNDKLSPSQTLELGEPTDPYHDYNEKYQFLPDYSDYSHLENLLDEPVGESDSLTNHPNKHQRIDGLELSGNEPLNGKFDFDNIPLSPENSYKLEDIEFNKEHPVANTHLLETEDLFPVNQEYSSVEDYPFEIEKHILTDELEITDGDILSLPNKNQPLLHTDVDLDYSGNYVAVPEDNKEIHSLQPSQVDGSNYPSDYLEYPQETLEYGIRPTGTDLLHRPEDDQLIEQQPDLDYLRRKENQPELEIEEYPKKQSQFSTLEVEYQDYPYYDESQQYGHEPGHIEYYDQSYPDIEGVTFLGLDYDHQPKDHRPVHPTLEFPRRKYQPLDDHELKLSKENDGTEWFSDEYVDPIGNSGKEIPEYLEYSHLPERVSQPGLLDGQTDFEKLEPDLPSKIPTLDSSEYWNLLQDLKSKAQGKKSVNQEFDRETQEPHYFWNYLTDDYPIFVVSKGPDGVVRKKLVWIPVHFPHANGTNELDVPDQTRRKHYLDSLLKHEFPDVESLDKWPLLDIDNKGSHPFDSTELLNYDLEDLIKANVNSPSFQSECAVCADPKLLAAEILKVILRVTNCYNASSNQVTNKLASGDGVIAAFDSWFLEQKNLIESNFGLSQDYTSDIDTQSLKLLIQRVLKANNIRINLHGDIEYSGRIISIRELTLRPILIGEKFGYSELNSQNNYAVPVNKPNLGALLLTLENPRKVLGIVPIGLMAPPGKYEAVTVSSRIVNKDISKVHQVKPGGTVWIHKASNLNHVFGSTDDDVGPDFRIIGGRPATGSGTPLSNKGRAGSIKL